MVGERSRSRLFDKLPVAMLMLASAATAQGLIGSRYPISGADIAKALSAVGVSVEASQVRVSSYMSAAIDSPKLEIVTAKPMGYNQVRLELHCATTAECLPFFATVDVKNADLISAKLQSKSVVATSTGHQAAGQIGAGLSSQARLRVGSHAVLTIRDGHLDIHLQVVVMDTGAIGQEVRVSTLDRKKVFHATVTGEATVTGVME